MSNLILLLKKVSIYEILQIILATITKTITLQIEGRIWLIHHLHCEMV